MAVARAGLLAPAPIAYAAAPAHYAAAPVAHYSAAPVAGKIFYNLYQKIKIKIFCYSL